MFQIQCFSNKIQLLLVGANGSDNTSNSMNINSLHYSNQLYTIYWNIKLKKHSLYYLTLLAIDTYGTTTSDTEVISKSMMHVLYN